MRRGLFAALLLAAPGIGQATSCDVEWQVSLRDDLNPHALDVTLRFNAEGRTETALRIQKGWAGINDYPKTLGSWSGNVQPTDDDHRWRVRHAADEQVTVRYRVASQPADADATGPQHVDMLYRTQVGAGWFQFFGYGVLAMPGSNDYEERESCLSFDGLAPGQAIVTSHGAGAGPTWRFAARLPAYKMWHAFYAGGRAWRVRPLDLPGGNAILALRGQFDSADDAIAQATQSLIATQRRFFGDEVLPPQLIAITPSHHKQGGTQGTRVAQAAAMIVPANFGPSSSSFEFLIAHENLHEWFPGRFGRMGSGARDTASRYWFSEGLTNHYTHRLLLASGQWTLERYATELTTIARRYLASPARNVQVPELAQHFFTKRDWSHQLYQRGEFLALRWDAALRERGHPGLDTVMRSLRLPIGTNHSALPEAPDRLIDALSVHLGALPRRDWQRLLVDGKTFDFEPGLLGPCFDHRIEVASPWTLGFSNDSFAGRSATGVVEGSAAWRAGLRNGTKLLGWSIGDGQPDKPVELDIEEADGRKRKLSYLPVGTTTEPLPRWTARADALGSAACMVWWPR